MNLYPKLCRQLLANGLGDTGFRVASGYLIREMGECVGGIEFQKSKHDDCQFYVNVGVMSKRIDRFQRRFTAEADSRPFDWQRAQIRHRLHSDDADCHERWHIKRTRPMSLLVDRLATHLLNDAVPFIEAFGTDARMRDALLADDSPHGYKLYRGSDWPRRSIALFYAAFLIAEIGPSERFDETLREAQAAVENSIEQDFIDRRIDAIGTPPMNPEDMIPQEALDRLREMTGQDFGDDYEAWQQWLKSNLP